MSERSPGLKAATPKNIFSKPLKFEFKQLFKALAKGISHTAIGKWEDLGVDAVETLAAIGMTTEPEELAFLLVRRSAIKALFDLMGHSANLLAPDAKVDPDTLMSASEIYITGDEFYIDRHFLDRPSDLPLVADLQQLFRFWLEGNGVSPPNAIAISERFPAYFVYALNEEWRKNAKSYRPLVESLESPFARATEREWAWSNYESLLQRRTQESVFDEPFSLAQIYIPLNAYYFDESKCESALEEKNRYEQRLRVVVSLHDALEQWVQRVLSGKWLAFESSSRGSVIWELR